MKTDSYIALFKGLMKCAHQLNALNIDHQKITEFDSIRKIHAKYKKEVQNYGYYPNSPLDQMLEHRASIEHACREYQIDCKMYQFDSASKARELCNGVLVCYIWEGINITNLIDI